MPWEAGYFQGHDRVPVREYLGLYPFVDRDRGTFRVNIGGSERVSLIDWLARIES